MTRFEQTEKAQPSHFRTNCVFAFVFAYVISVLWALSIAIANHTVNRAFIWTALAPPLALFVIAFLMGLVLVKSEPKSRILPFTLGIVIVVMSMFRWTVHGLLPAGIAGIAAIIASRTLADFQRQPDANRFYRIAGNRLVLFGLLLTRPFVLIALGQWSGLVPYDFLDFFVPYSAVSPDGGIRATVMAYGAGDPGEPCFAVLGPYYTVDGIFCFPVAKSGTDGIRGFMWHDHQLTIGTQKPSRLLQRWPLIEINTSE